ncbi:tannase and feruloyl esterase [Xylaria curta]|nr:tannase and feruloyl esterase [Xylaria curta]
MALSMDIMASRCVPETFNAIPAAFGIDILSVSSSLVRNFTMESDASLRYTHPSTKAENLTFCNVTTTYTHPETDDEVNVETWLPLADWNERLYAAGGGGFGAGRFFIPYTTMAGALTEGYATVTTDAGLGSDAGALDASSWALLSRGNINLQLSQNFGSSSLNEEAIIAKEILKAFYGKPPLYSYWNGCSQGGRQGLVLAQRYPQAFDGIVVGCPAINWPQVAGSIFWPQQYMDEMGKYPFECEVDAIVHAAITVCDGLDDVVDGIIAEPEACLERFDPFEYVGKEVDCWPQGDKRRISKAAASVVNATWMGISSSSGKKLWHGLNPGANLTGRMGFQGGVAGTDCSSDGICTGRRNPLGTRWIQLFAAKDEDFDVGVLTREDFQRLVHQSAQELTSFFGTDDADLTAFQHTGGKMISWHGLADDVIPPKRTETYYQEVSNLLPGVQEFYRHFEIPGLAHCSGGVGGQPTAMFEQLRAWVENGTAPKSSPVQYIGPDGEEWHRVVCPYPLKSKLKDHHEDPKAAGSWKCE